MDASLRCAGSAGGGGGIGKESKTTVPAMHSGKEELAEPFFFVSLAACISEYL